MCELSKTGVLVDEKKILLEFICKTYFLWILDLGNWMLVPTNCQFIEKETTIVPEKQDS
jgi:hypothetical protein